MEFYTRLSNNSERIFLLNHVHKINLNQKIYPDNIISVYETSDIRKGLRIEMDGEPFIVIEFQFVKPGKGTAFTRTKVRNLINGAVIDRTFKSGENSNPQTLKNVPCNIYIVMVVIIFWTQVIMNK